MLRSTGPLATRPVVLAAFLLAGLLAATVRAERPTAPKLLPESTLAYARVHDVKDLINAFQESSIGQMFQDPQIKAFVNDLYGSASEAFQQIEAEAGLSLDELLGIPQGEACLAIVGADRGLPAFIAIVQVDDQLTTAEKVVDRVIERIEGRGGAMETLQIHDTLITSLKRPNDQEIVVFDRDGALVVTNDRDLAKQVLAVWSGRMTDAKTLADNPHFVSIMKECAGIQGERPQVTWFVDPVSLIKQATRGNLTAAATVAFLDPLGVDGIRGVGGSLILRPEADFESISQIHILLDNPRKGVVEMLAFAEGETTPEKFVPADAASYMTVNWDLSKTYSEANRLLSIIRADPEEDALDDAIKEYIDRRAGIDFKKQIFEQLEGRATLFTWIQKPARLNSQCTFIGVKVKDPAAVKEAILAAAAKFNVTLEKKFYGSVEYYETNLGRRLEQNPDRFDTNILRAPEPMIVFLDDYVAYMDSVQLMKAVVDAAAKSEGSLAFAPDYQEIADKIEDHTHGELLGMMAFARPEEGLRAIYELARADATQERLKQASDNPFFGALSRALEKNELPPFDALVKYFSPTGTVVTNTPTGIHWMQFALKNDPD